MILDFVLQKGIGQGTNLGTTHIKVKDEIIRTPLGGFINHSDEGELREDGTER